MNFVCDAVKQGTIILPEIPMLFHLNFQFLFFQTIAALNTSVSRECRACDNIYKIQICYHTDNYAIDSSFTWLKLRLIQTEKNKTEDSQILMKLT